MSRHTFVYVRRLAVLSALAELAVAAFVPTRAAAQAEFGIFIGPPVPVASQAYSVRVHATTFGPPITVENVTIGVNGQVVDVMFYFNHGDDSSSLAVYRGTVAGVPLLAGTYTFRLFTRDRFVGHGDYGHPPGTGHQLTRIVTPAGNVGEAVDDT